jgi:hypothetical protein
MVIRKHPKQLFFKKASVDMEPASAEILKKYDGQLQQRC